MAVAPLLGTSAASVEFRPQSTTARARCSTPTRCGRYSRTSAGVTLAVRASPNGWGHAPFMSRASENESAQPCGKPRRGAANRHGLPCRRSRVRVPSSTSRNSPACRGVLMPGGPGRGLVAGHWLAVWLSVRRPEVKAGLGCRRAGTGRSDGLDRRVNRRGDSRPS